MNIVINPEQVAECVELLGTISATLYLILIIQVANLVVNALK